MPTRSNKCLHLVNVVSKCFKIESVTRTLFGRNTKYGLEELLDALRDLAPVLQLKRPVKLPWRSVNF